MLNGALQQKNGWTQLINDNLDYFQIGRDLKKLSLISKDSFKEYISNIAKKLRLKNWLS